MFWEQANALAVSVCDYKTAKQVNICDILFCLFVISNLSCKLYYAPDIINLVLNDGFLFANSLCGIQYKHSF